MALLTASCATAPNVPPSITWTRHASHSSVLGAARQYLVALPAGYQTSTDRYPVLLILDAEDEPMFVAALAAVRYLEDRTEIPPLIVVGIPNGPDRTHDLTPGSVDAFTKRQSPTAGGADQFLTFLTDELIPALRTRYRTRPLTVLAGHSHGGLFGIHAAATRPGSFDATIAMSPSVWRLDSLARKQYVAALAARSTPHRLFVTSGGFEPNIDGPVVEFVTALDGSPKPLLSFGHARYERDDHLLTPLSSFADGLRFVFQPVSLAGASFNLLASQALTARMAASPRAPQLPDSAALLAAVDLDARRYAEGARALGLPERLPESVLREWGFATMSWGLAQPAAAVPIFQRNVQMYPRSASAYGNLGDALLQRGDTAGARAQFRQAIAIARETRDTTGTALAAKLRDLDTPRPR